MDRSDINQRAEAYASLRYLSSEKNNAANLGFKAGAESQHPIAFEQGRMQGKFEAIDHILESLESGQIQTWAATVHHLKVLKEAAVKQLEAMRKV